MIPTYLLIGIVYLILLGYLSTKWRIELKKILPDASLPPVSVIVPFRNEEANLTDIFLLLNQQADYALEIIWIDDHSEDASYSRLKKMISESGKKNKHRLYSSKATGKKAAIETAVLQARGEIILCTDADCAPPKSWIRNMTARFLNPELQLVAGTVMTRREDSLYAQMQEVEWASILLVTQFGFATGNPITCSAANLAYRKQAFREVNGFEGNRAVASGDDEFLLKKIISQYGKQSVCYQAHKSTTVITKPARQLAALISQRVRWASKWHAHKSAAHAFTAIIAFAWQLLFLTAILIGAGSSAGWPGAVLLIGMKFLAEYLTLGKVMKDLAKLPKPYVMLLTSLIHPIFVVVVALKTLSGKYTWKGRSNESIV